MTPVHRLVLRPLGEATSGRCRCGYWSVVRRSDAKVRAAWQQHVAPVQVAPPFDLSPTRASFTASGATA